MKAKEQAGPDPLYAKVWLIAGLADGIYWAKKNYYHGMPTLTDEVYDAMERELKKLLPSHPLLVCVGAPTIEFNLGRQEILYLLCKPTEEAEKEELEDIFS